MIKCLVEVVSERQSALFSGNAVAGAMYGMRGLAHITSVFLILVVMCGSSIHASDEGTDASDSGINSQSIHEMGVLVVRRFNSNHSGQDRVFIDGIFRGSTRLDIQLPQGEHTIRVEQDGFKSDQWTMVLDKHEIEWASLEPEVKQELPTTTADKVEQEFWELVRDSGNPTLIQEYLRQYPNGRFSSEAERILKKVMGEEAMIGTVVPIPNRLIPDLDYGNYYALIIGNNQYKHFPDLRTAVNDARAVAHLLESNYGFNVTLLTNATRSVMLSSIKNLRHQVSADDNVLVYYAGHGLVNPETGEGFWLPIDADREDESNWLLTDRVRAKVKVMPAKHVLVVADSCFSGKFTRSVTRGFTIEPDAPNYVPALQRLVVKRSRTVLTSGGLESVLDAVGNSKHSVFAEAFLSILESNEKVLDGARLFHEIRFKVINNSSQTPEYSPIHEGGHDGGDFLFVRR